MCRWLPSVVPHGQPALTGPGTGPAVIQLRARSLCSLVFAHNHAPDLEFGLRFASAPPDSSQPFWLLKFTFSASQRRQSPPRSASEGPCSSLFHSSAPQPHLQNQTSRKRKQRIRREFLGFQCSCAINSSCGLKQAPEAGGSGPRPQHKINNSSEWQPHENQRWYRVVGCEVGLAWLQARGVCKASGP